MHTVELLDRALKLAAHLGFRLRHEYLGGSRGGGCEIKGQKWIFVDLALTPREQLQQVIDAVRQLPEIPPLDIGPELRSLLRKAA